MGLNRQNMPKWESDVSQIVPICFARGIEVILDRIEEVQIEVSDAWRCGWSTRYLPHSCLDDPLVMDISYIFINDDD